MLLLYFILFISCLQQLIHSSEQHKCFPCDNPFVGYNRCRNKQNKIVDSSGLCAVGCSQPTKSCSRQIGKNGSECDFIHTSSSGCSADRVRSWPILQCDGPSGSCHCPAPSSGPVPLEDEVVITAYSFECGCATNNQHVSAPDIRIRNSGWSVLSLVSDSAKERWCGQFRLRADGLGHWLRYDCPLYERRMEGRALSLHLCTDRHTVSYRLKLPNRTQISAKSRSVHTWEPLIAVHMHRSDRLVYSVQRSPPALNITQYDVQLVHCEDDNCYRTRTVHGTKRQLQEAASVSELDAEVFRVEFDAPEAGGSVSLRVQPRGGRPTLSAVVLHPGQNTTQLAIVVSVFVLILVLAMAAFIWFKFFRKSKMPEVVEALVVYNSNGGLARYVARQLEIHCMIKTKLDLVDIPCAGSGMDPVKWMTTELSRCQHVLLLVFPENTAPSIYPQLYPVAVNHLIMDAGKKRVVIGHAGGDDCAPLPYMPAASRFRLPTQLSGLVRAVRGAARPGTGYLDARELARRLVCSEDGCQLARLLAEPTAVPPAEVTPLPAAAEPPPLPPLPTAPPRNGEQMAPHVHSVDVLLDPPVPPLGPPAADDVADDDIQWH